MSELVMTGPERDALDAVLDRATELAMGADGPVFTAAIVHDGKMISLSRNEVSDTCDPSRHAEIVAISRAGKALGRADLSGATLIASMQPCEMCLTTMRWAGIDRLIFAMTQDRAPAFFKFSALKIDDFARAADTPFEWLGGAQAGRVAHIYEPHS